MSNPRKVQKGRHEPERNLFCSKYSECLDFAVSRGWHSFSCDQCECRNVADHTDPDPLFSITSLVWAVCFPERWARFVATAERFLRDGDS
jgi:hypothetical protein